MTNEDASGAVALAFVVSRGPARLVSDDTGQTGRQGIEAMQSPHAATLCFGASGGFTMLAAVEMVSNPRTGLFTFLASLVSTLVGLWISERARKSRDEFERAREQHQVDRDKWLIESMQAMQRKG